MHKHRRVLSSIPNIRCHLRRDAKFRRLEYGKHLREYYPIMEISGIDMVQDFIIADSLHLLELGVMKRCLCKKITSK